MNKKDKQEPDTQQLLIEVEDLTLNEDHAAEVKGGASGDGSVRIVRHSVAQQL